MDKIRVLTISPKSTFLKTIKGILKSPASKNKSWPKLQIDHFPSFSEKIPGELLELVRIAFVDFDSLSLTWKAVFDHIKELTKDVEVKSMDDLGKAMEAISNPINRVR